MIFLTRVIFVMFGVTLGGCGDSGSGDCETGGGAGSEAVCSSAPGGPSPTDRPLRGNFVGGCMRSSTCFMWASNAVASDFTIEEPCVQQGDEFVAEGCPEEGAQAACFKSQYGYTHEWTVHYQLDDQSREEVRERCDFALIGQWYDHYVFPGFEDPSNAP